MTDTKLAFSDFFLFFSVLSLYSATVITYLAISYLANPEVAFLPLNKIK